MANPLKVLVFGDSQGDTGPTYHALQDVFDKHNTNAKVINKSVGGTLACGWAQNPDAIVKAAEEAFPGTSPDLVWYTAGANDMGHDQEFHACLDKAMCDSDVAECINKANAKVMNCTVTLLENLWTAFPKARVGQYNYEEPCLDTQDCLEEAANFLGGSYCLKSAEPKVCVERALMYWQSIYVDALQKRYPVPQYTGMNVLGAEQKAAGVLGSAVGKLVLGQGAKCAWTVLCGHPKYGTPGATAIADAMWDLWLSKVVNSTATIY